MDSCGRFANRALEKKNLYPILRGTITLTIIWFISQKIHEVLLFANAIITFLTYHKYPENNTVSIQSQTTCYNNITRK